MPVMRHFGFFIGTGGGLVSFFTLIDTYSQKHN